MYYVINRMDAVAPYAGRVLSSHFTLDAARKADQKVQRGVRRRNGRSSYLPTSIVQARINATKGTWLTDGDIIPAMEW
jgi:hypothetical protein